MRARVSFVSRTAKGGIATRDQDVEADVIRFGRSTDNEVYLADPRVPLHLAVLHERPSGTAVETPEGLRRLTTRVQPHERPMELFIEAIGAADLRHNGAVKRSCQVAVGDILALGPFDVTLVAPPEGCTAAFSVEMARPLGDDLQALQARSVTTVRATSTSKRAWAFGLGGVVLLLFLVIPVLGAVIPGVREASRGWAVATDTAWLPGALSRPHQLFGGDCGNCHVAAFTPVQDTACRTCHEDAGEHLEAAAHPDVNMAGERCADCHVEHTGAKLPHGFGATACTDCHGDLKRIAANTAIPRITGFVADHPQFPERYPHIERTAIKFNHVTHLNTHFADQRFTDRAPKDCIACHSADPTSRAIIPAGFESSCAGCHADQIPSRPLVVMRLPALSSPIAAPEDLSELCGPSIAEFDALAARLSAAEAAMQAAQEAGEVPAADEAEPDADEEAEFESVSDEELPAAAAYLLGVAPDDSDTYAEPVTTLVMGMAEQGAAGLREVVGERVSPERADALLAGMSDEMAKRVACAWAGNQEYEPIGDPVLGGWFGDYLELKYRPREHADPVLKAWLDIASGPVASDDEPYTMLRDELFSAKDGPGACVKCHAVSARGEGEAAALGVDWRYRGYAGRAHYAFSHGVHLKLVRSDAASILDPQEGCGNCHKVDPQADFVGGFAEFDTGVFQSNFVAIRIETCEQCHKPGDVRDDCQLCHRYHDRRATQQVLVTK